MSQLRLLLALPVLLALGFSARADEGMWPFDLVPTAQIQKKYGFAISDAWLEHVQKSSVRFNSGGSGSLVSANGLVMTNHHVGSGMLEKMSTPGNNLIEKGFYAKTRADEVPCPDLEVNILWSIEDVTARVNGAVQPGMDDAAAGKARREIMSTIESESKDKTGLRSDVVTLYQGGRYSLYCYKAYQDVRLVMAPEKGIAFFGGDPDNFEYPRFDLDMCFFRIYENGKPLQAEHFLAWSKNGTTDNELVFVSGHPGRTERLFTVEHLKFLRDVAYPLQMRNQWRREVQLATFRGRSPENARIAEGEYFGVQNSRKARTGILEGLQDERMFAKKQEAERKLRDAVAASPEYKAQWGDAWDEIAAAEKTYATFFERMNAPGVGNGSLGGLYGTARGLLRIAAEDPKENSQRLREYTNARRDSLLQQLFSPAPVYPELEIDRLASGLQLMTEMLGADDPAVVQALGGLPPRLRAEQLIHGTKLGDVAERKRLYDGKQAAIDASKDPLIALAKAFDAENRAQRKRFEDEVDSKERAGYAKIAQAQFAIYGNSLYPDATFTLRLSYGTIKGYQQDGQQIPPFTNFAGLYQRSEERHNQYPFELPPRWAGARDMLNPNTPFNFVSTCDIIGGNSGSPTINKAGEVVGLIFDGNIQSLVLDIAYEDEVARAVSVDTRAILEALRKIYDCQAMADEIEGKRKG
ncbi:MAG: S46 family peptidase [Planctomycetes bacterium]|nr:S46 family peptidase [Planctomycetota bacterium]